MKHIALTLALICAACDHRADVHVKVSFDGKGCAAAGVASAAIDLTAQSVSNYVYSCSQLASGEVEVGLFPPGPYQLTITGYDAAGAVLYVSDTPVSLPSPGDITFTVDAPRAQ